MKLNDPTSSDVDFLRRQAKECAVWDKWRVSLRLLRIASALERLEVERNTAIREISKWARATGKAEAEVDRLRKLIG
jgi:hypothetical protein